MTEQRRLTTSGQIRPKRGSKMVSRENPEVVLARREFIHMVEQHETAAREAWR
jgi:hypothetical protein